MDSLDPLRHPVAGFTRSITAAGNNLPGRAETAQICAERAIAVLPPLVHFHPGFHP
jgi:hypothetical protein